MREFVSRFRQNLIADSEHTGALRAYDAVKRTNDALAVLGVFLMVAVAIMSVADVLVMRTLLNRPIPGTNEVFATLFAIAVASILPSGISNRAHLEVNIFEKFFGEILSKMFRLFGAILTAFSLAFVSVALWKQTSISFAQDYATQIFQWPLGPVFAVISSMITLAALTQLIVIASDIKKLVQYKLHLWTTIISTFILSLFLYIAALGFQSTFISMPGTLTLLVFCMIWLLIGFLVPLGTALMISSMLGVTAFLGYSAMESVVGSETVSLFSSASLAIIPLYLLMGGFAVIGGMADDLFRFAQAILAPFRGGLALATIAGSAGFGALSGSSTATVVSIGSLAYPQMTARGYSPKLATGSIAAGGTLGQLIPPSTVVVLYAILVEQSVGILYIAILLPAILTILLYLLTVVLIVWFRPGLVPKPAKYDPEEIIVAAKRCVPACVLFTVVFGGIYLGIVTVSEAAALGVTLTLGVAIYRKSIRPDAITRILADTTRSTSMIYLMIMGALVLTFYVASTRLPETILSAIVELDISPWQVILLLVVMLALLGTILESITIMMVTASIAASIIEQLGFSPVWWGIIMIAVVEIGVITPPFGINLYMMKGVAPDVPLTHVYRGALPFVIADIFKIFILITFPAISLWLPSQL